ncbi:MAG: RnfABCDGE type electron transport complex subunit D [Planctomycetaceae bacterium]|nr:RnfABCDGE type electron transport complex subunit D [Planctomycetaceae bacterium]
MLSKITVTPAPHISSKLSTQTIMLDVIIALTPAIGAAVIFFHDRALVLIGSCVLACLWTERICNWIRKQPSTIGDLSAVVTGIILALSLPPAMPWWAAVMGGAFAIAIVKVLFGGLGGNIFNPAMAARAFLTACFGVLMTTWTAPATIDAAMPQMGPMQTEAITQATPLAWAKMAVKKETSTETLKAQLSKTFWGNEGGCLGETSALALLVGGAYLLWRKTITWHIPLTVLAAAAAFSAVFYFIDPSRYANPLFHILSGGMLLGALFIATDPVTAPLTSKGMLVFGAGVGALIMLIRIIGEYPEGVMYAVLVMNALAPLIDRAFKMVPAGGIPNVK